MLKKIRLWYGSKPVKTRLLITLACNFLWWFFVQYIIEVIIPDDEPKSFRSLLFGGLFMGTFWTLSFNWNLVKVYFKKR